MNQDVADIIAHIAADRWPANVGAMHLVLHCERETGFAVLEAAIRQARGEAGRRLARVRVLLEAHPEAWTLAPATLRAFESARGADALARVKAGFDAAARRSPEAAAALYSLGDPVLLNEATEEIVALLTRWGIALENRTVLDLGCGAGRVADALSRRGASVVGLDVSIEMLRAARRRVPGASFLRGTGTDLACLAANAFDLIIAVDSFPYMVEAGVAERMWPEIARILRAGGDIVVLNYSYGRALGEDEADILALGPALGLHALRLGAREFSRWDGDGFHLRKSAIRRSTAPPTRDRSRAVGS